METGYPVDAFTTADGTRLHLTELGRPDAPLTVVLAHGWTLDQRCWEPVARRLHAAHPDLRVVCYDHRGHGRSAPARTGTATIDQLADDLAELLTSRIGGPVVLAGHSMGGMTIMGLAERYPELVAERVVGAAFVATSSGDLVPMELGLPPGLAKIVSTGERRLVRRRPSRARPGGTRRSTRTVTRTASPRRIRLIGPGVRWLLLGSHPRREDVELTARCVAECRPATMTDFRPTFDHHDRRAALAAFTGTPTTVLGGERDRLTPVRHSGVIAAELPDATLVRYAGAGHMVPLERAEQVALRIGELARVAVRSRR